MFVGGPRHGETINPRLLGRPEIHTLPPPDWPVVWGGKPGATVEVEFERVIYRRQRYELGPHPDGGDPFDVYVHTGGALDHQWSVVLNTAPLVRV